MLNKRGFTLIELLVVLSIIALLSTMVTAGVRHAKKTSEDAKRMADINTIQRAIELANLDAHDYREVLGSGCSTIGKRVRDCNGTVTTTLANIVNVYSVQKSSVGCVEIISGCDFSIVEEPTVNTYKIGFWLEGGIAQMDEGAHYLTENGVQ